MYTYEHKVSLRITHPTIDPQSITNTLGLKPSRSWQVGTPRKTPNGGELEAINIETYWSAQLSNGKIILSEEVPLESYLLEKTNILYRIFWLSWRIERNSREYRVSYWCFL